jgi:hypothetical protein
LYFVVSVFCAFSFAALVSIILVGENKKKISSDYAKRRSISTDKIWSGWVQI